MRQLVDVITGELDTEGFYNRLSQAEINSRSLDTTTRILSFREGLTTDLVILTNLRLFILLSHHLGSDDHHLTSRQMGNSACKSNMKSHLRSSSVVSWFWLLSRLLLMRLPLMLLLLPHHDYNRYGIVIAIYISALAATPPRSIGTGCAAIGMALGDSITTSLIIATGRSLP